MNGGDTNQQSSSAAKGQFTKGKNPMDVAKKGLVQLHYTISVGDIVIMLLFV